MAKINKSNSNIKNGFTLVELMVVIAMIGIVTSIAIPKYNKYISRSRVIEGKLRLSELRTAVLAHMAEYDTPASCMYAMGVSGNLTNNWYASLIVSTGSDNSLARDAGLTSCDPGIDVEPARRSADGTTFISDQNDILGACGVSCFDTIPAGETIACVAGIIHEDFNDVPSFNNYEGRPSVICWNYLSQQITVYGVGY